MEISFVQFFMISTVSDNWNWLSFLEWVRDVCLVVYIYIFSQDSKFSYLILWCGYAVYVNITCSNISSCECVTVFSTASKWCLMPRCNICVCNWVRFHQGQRLKACLGLRDKVCLCFHLLKLWLRLAACWLIWRRRPQKPLEHKRTDEFAAHY